MPSVSVVPEAKCPQKTSGSAPKTDSANDVEYNFFYETVPDKNVLEPLKRKAKYLIEQRPRHSKTDFSTYVSINLVINRIRSVDSKRGCVDMRFIITCQWRLDFDYFTTKSVFQTECNPPVTGREYYKTTVVDTEKIWCPPIEVLNRDDLTIVKDPTLLFLDKGYARCLYHCNGTLSQEMNLKLFPFDFEVIPIRVIGSIGTQEREVKLFWREERKLKHILTDRVIEELTEFQIIYNNIFVERMNSEWSERTFEYLQNRKICGEHNGLEISIPIQRQYGFYMKKIMLILTMLCSIGWTIFYLDEFVNRLEIQTSLFLAGMRFSTL